MSFNEKEILNLTKKISKKSNFALNYSISFAWNVDKLMIFILVQVFFKKYYYNAVIDGTITSIRKIAQLFSL